jgi:formate-dependent nitrite reductase membrane component NrfD
MSPVHTVVVVGSLIILALLIFANDRLEQQKAPAWLPMVIVAVIALIAAFALTWSWRE